VATEADKRAARIWYKDHRREINAMLGKPGEQIEPRDNLLPERWWPEHWRWFMVGEVAKQIGVKV
jgi:hypothetical protein